VSAVIVFLLISPDLCIESFTVLFTSKYKIMKNILIPILALFTITMSFVSCNEDEPDNKIPVIQSVQVNPSSVSANGIVTVSVVAGDPDGDFLTYSYFVTGGAINGTGPNVSWTAPSTPGAQSVTVTVSDGKGGTATGNGALTVEQSVTQITGTASFLPGTAGDLNNAVVNVYTSRENWLAYSPIKKARITSVGAVANFTITGINPGNYYVDVWKDNDNNGFWSAGDFVGVFGRRDLGADGLSEIQIAQGQTVNISIDMIIL
jgi:hypothetical protein